MLSDKKICVIGGGKMGSALIEGLLSKNVISATNIYVTDIDEVRLSELESKFGVRTTKDNRQGVRETSISILAVKPQNMGEVLDEISDVVDETKLIISIAAGIKIGFIESKLGKKTRIIRTMPNTPLVVGEGMTALSAGENATADDLAIARYIFDAVGETVLVKEELMDAVTGLSGSGPAYCFIIVEALSDGGVQMGLPRDVAVKLAAQTLLGAARMVLKGNYHTGQLKDMVTSPGGTTIAGIRAMEEKGIRAALMAAVEAATLRSRTLGT
ncbi:MAG: pyrroline-5-carboxylate reductase [Syntrophales bacterium]|nr:pyrroline-5-carboxylate reductase [Syntrophales bacterium]